MGKRRAKAPTLRQRWDALWEELFTSVDIASLAVTRIAFGLAVAWETYAFLFQRLVEVKFRQPGYLVPWQGFEWLTRWPGDGLYLHFYATLLLSLCFAAGLLYRVVAPLLCLCLTYIFLLSPANNLNHAYLCCLLALLFCLMPAHRALSVDAWLRPSLRSETTPAWTVWVLRFQMGLVYFYGGVAKIQWDWLQGYPMRLWLPPKANLPLLGPLFETPWVPLVMSWSGLLIDLLAAPALLHRKTRPWAFAILASFHCWNSQLFSIGVFPWLAIALTTIFFEPDWPRRVFRWPHLGAEPVLRLGWSRPRVWLAGFLSVYVALQVLVPLRHLLVEGNTSWTDVGHDFAWRMMLRGKKGFLSYELTDPDTQETWRVDPRGELGMTQYNRVTADPGMIHTYAQHLAALAREDGHRRVEVRAVVLASLNAREPQPLVDREVDLVHARNPRLRRPLWIVPLTTPLGTEWLAGSGFEKSTGEEDPD